MAKRYQNLLFLERAPARRRSISFLFAALLSAIFFTFTTSAEGQPQEGGNPKSLRPEELAVPVDDASLQLQYATLAGMALEMIEYHKNNLVRFIRGSTGLEVSKHKSLKAGDCAADIAAKLQPLLLTTGTEQFTVRHNRLSEELGRRNIQLTQSIAGIPVVPGLLSLSVDENTGEIVELLSTVIPDRGLLRKPKITAQQAKQVAARHLEGAGWAEPRSAIPRGDPKLAYFAGTAEARKPALVWTMKVDFLTADRPPPATPGGSPVTWQVFVDAADGAYLGQIAVTLQLEHEPLPSSQLQAARCGDSLALADQVNQPITALVSRNSLNPSRPHSRPLPDCL